MSYAFEHAEEEMAQFGMKIISRAEKLAEDYNIIELAKICVLLNKEIFHVEDEARKLRLTGQLKLDIYQGMVQGYRAVLDRVFYIAREYTMTNEIKTLYKAMKFSNELAGTYLAEYLHESEVSESAK